MREHVPSGKLTISAACGDGRLYPLHSGALSAGARGRHGLREHVPSGKLAFGVACSPARLLCSIIWV